MDRPVPIKPSSEQWKAQVIEKMVHFKSILLKFLEKIF